MILHFSEPPSEIVLTAKCQMHRSLLIFSIFISDLFHDPVCLTLNLPCHLEVSRCFQLFLGQKYLQQFDFSHFQMSSPKPIIWELQLLCKLIHVEQLLVEVIVSFHLKRLTKLQRLETKVCSCQGQQDHTFSYGCDGSLAQKFIESKFMTQRPTIMQTLKPLYILY